MEIRIGDLAKRSGCEVVTIRYYEKEGLLPNVNGGAIGNQMAEQKGASRFVN